LTEVALQAWARVLWMTSFASARLAQVERRAWRVGKLLKGRPDAITTLGDLFNRATLAAFGQQASEIGAD